MTRTHKDGIKPGIYVFPVVKFLVDMMVNADARSGDRFLPVNLVPIGGGFAIPSQEKPIPFR